MDVNNIKEIKDGDPTRSVLLEAPSILDVPKGNKQKLEINVKKKRRRGKSKRKIMKPFCKIPWQGRKIDNTQRVNRFRKLVVTKTQAPFNNNQFLMEIHKPEPENNFQILTTPSARTRDSSFSVDSEDNYFYSLPEDEEEYLTKEFSSVYEDAQCERLSNMSKNELIQEYLLLEAKYDNLVKRTERYKVKESNDDKDSIVDKDASINDRDSMMTDRDTSETSVMSGSIDEPSFKELLQRMKEQEEQICDLQSINDKLRIENEGLRQRTQDTSEDSESDSSSSSDSGSTSSCNSSPARDPVPAVVNGNHVPVSNDPEVVNSQPSEPLVNGFHSPDN
ncbi:uncharacterized protein Hexim [Epargyreus clarus]|uniref:uncharacterized protein Hexim n=1 Tax=Epargyreus clarus TaxID=520877 RepID=UPI003C30BA74